MPQDKIKITPTSKSSADVDPIVLREGPMVRLVFKPIVVENPNDPAAAVSGTFVYQKKRRNTLWQDCESFNLASLKTGEEVRLELHTAEVFKLIQALNELYRIVLQNGIPSLTAEYVKAPRSSLFRQLLEEGDFDQLVRDAGQQGLLLRKFLGWLTSRSTAELSQNLASVDAIQLLNFDAAIGVSRLKAFSAEYQRLNENESAIEDDWQELLQKHSWVLSQVYAQPIVIIRGQAYVGGKRIDNTEGNIVDFLYRNEVTDDAILVEIKKPTTQLLSSSPYRNNVYNVLSEVSGGTQQLLGARRIFLEEYRVLTRGERLEVFNPRALLVIGDVQRELTSQDKRRSFEFYRRNLRDVDVITFDELHAKVLQLIQLLELS